jgi:hypothetical protein
MAEPTREICSHWSTLIASAVKALAAILALAISTDCLSADRYDLVKIEYDSLKQESAAPLCRTLLQRLNAERYEPPMTCRRKFDPQYSYLETPDWQPLDSNDSIAAALALERSWAERGPRSDVQRRFAALAAKVHKNAEMGRLRAWQARFNFGSNGERVRVVLISRGNYQIDGQCYYDTRFGVLLPDGFKVDARYKNLSPYHGELFFYGGTTYIGVWSNVPSATLHDRIGPPNRHRGYLLIQTIRPPGPHGPASAFDTVCQVGYGHGTNGNGKDR